ncbi:MAG TPA: hypothetical protein VJ577_18875 [Burkholderiaceae bacterium]|nr:hypothetical protein [Burkholderiaceae bacterium]
MHPSTMTTSGAANKMSNSTALTTSLDMFELGDLPTAAVEQTNSEISDADIDNTIEMQRKERLRCHVMTACSKPVA